MFILMQKKIDTHIYYLYDAQFPQACGRPSFSLAFIIFCTKSNLAINSICMNYLELNCTWSIGLKRLKEAGLQRQTADSAGHLTADLWPWSL